MKAQAIIYTSNTGFTREYAKLLSQLTGLTAYDLKDKTPAAQTTVVYMGWLMAGGLKGYKKAAKRYKIAAVCAVGMAEHDDNQFTALQEKYDFHSAKLFYLQGGYAPDKLHGIYKIMMKTMERMVGGSIEKKENPSEAEKQALHEIKNGSNHVCAENLAEAAEYINNLSEPPTDSVKEK